MNDVETLSGEAQLVEDHDVEDVSDVDAVVDTESVAPVGEPCDACGAPVESLDRFCTACANPNPHFKDAPPIAEQVDDEAKAHFFRCQNCGAEVRTEEDQRSYVCPFCDSTYVAEFDPDTASRQPPEFVIGFALTHDEALEKFQTWLASNSFFRPGDLKMAEISEKLKGVYLPFWSFSMLADSRWAAQIGEHWYRTETYTTTDSKGNVVTRTRRVTETEWYDLAGRHHHYYSGYLVSGSKGLAQDQAERIKPFQLPALKRYEPYFLAGWLSEEYSVERAMALSICQREFHTRESTGIAGFLPGDTQRGLNVDTDFKHVNSDLCLLPVYMLSYRYGDKVYRFLCNGQTGKIAGDKPWSKKRISISAAIAVVLGLLLG
jgi:hypothetical protein